MSKYCLTLDEKRKFKEALKNGEIKPDALVAMTSLERRAFLEKYVGAENAISTNSLFESKLLLKNQKAGYISWAKKVSGISPTVKRDLLTRIQKLDKVLDPKDNEQFLNDLASARLGVEVTQEEAKVISDTSNKIAELKKLADKEGKMPNDTDRLTLGAHIVSLENYFGEVKLKANNISFKETPIKKILSVAGEVPGVLKSLVASMDNSFWGRQGIKSLIDVRTSRIWAVNFMRSWINIKNQLFASGKWYGSGDDAVLNGIKADIYSRPNALNGKYDAGGYGLTALTEEAYPSSFPEKIPFLGRIFKASEVAYNGGALQLRADLADRLIGVAERQGINTLDKDEARALGSLIGSLTGRGSLGKAETLSKEINVLAFSIKFLKSNFDTLTAHQFDPEATPFSKKEAAKNLLSIIASIASILFIAKLLNKDSVDEDPRSTNFGKVKVFGKFVDITGGMGSLFTLASRLVPTYHDGKWSFWRKSTTGEYVDLLGGEYGQQNAMDVFDSFWQGKLSPIAGIVRDLWKGQDYQGQPVTPVTVAQRNLPLSIQNFDQLRKDPNASFPLGSLILDGLGFSVSSSVEPNIKSKLIPEGKKISGKDALSTMATYAEAIGTDPVTAFNRMFKGETIRKVEGGMVIVERMSLTSSEALKKKYGKKNQAYKADHFIPLELGGDNSIGDVFGMNTNGNLKLVTTSQWSSYTAVENALKKAVVDKKISNKEAVKLITELKQATGTDKFSDMRKRILNKYK